jgi:5-methylcytosine-specific restriction protein A
MSFYAPLDPKAIQKQRDLAKKLRSSSWWKQKLQEGHCFYCRGNFKPNELTMDHKVPIARGGKSSRENIVACCKDCNSKKGSQCSVDLALKNLTL